MDVRLKPAVMLHAIGERIADVDDVVAPLERAFLRLCLTRKNENGKAKRNGTRQWTKHEEELVVVKQLRGQGGIG